MRLASVRRDDIVQVDKGGRLFLGIVTEVGERELAFEPITRGITWRRADAREVVGHWAKRAGTRARLAVAS